MESVSDQSRDDDLVRRSSQDAEDAACLPSTDRPARRRAAATLTGDPRHASAQARGSRPPQDDSPRLVTGNSGDHRLIHALLRAVQQAPSQEEFATWLDEPSYEPSDRLLVKRGDRIVAHLQLLYRGAWFHGVQLPVSSVQDLAVLPEYRQLGHDRLLLCVAEQTMRDNQSVVSLVRTDRPEVFRAMRLDRCPRTRLLAGPRERRAGSPLGPNRHASAPRTGCEFACGTTSNSTRCTTSIACSRPRGGAPGTAPSRIGGGSWVAERARK